MQFDELLDSIPSLRYRRRLSASVLSKLLCRKHGYCTWCGIKCPKGRYSWCSKRCFESFCLRCQPSAAARYVRHRDRGICQICWSDVGPAGGEVDHILPVCQGGGLCPPENLRLLCMECHEQVTSKLMLALRKNGGATNG